MFHWIIRGLRSSSIELLGWSKTDGWVDRSSATMFTESEKDSINLPIAGIWELVDLGEKEREAQYVKSKGSKCLFCLSLNITVEPYEGDMGVVYYEVICEDCNRSWQDNYTLTGVTYL